MAADPLGKLGPIYTGSPFLAVDPPGIPVGSPADPPWIKPEFIELVVVSTLGQKDRLMELRRLCPSREWAI